MQLKTFQGHKLLKYRFHKTMFGDLMISAFKSTIYSLFALSGILDSTANRGLFFILISLTLICKMHQKVLIRLNLINIEISLTNTAHVYTPYELSVSPDI